MSLLKILQGIGDRLGILETVADAGDVSPRRIQTRAVTLKELECEIKSMEVRALADSPAELETSFDKIYEAAGISSKAIDWTIERLGRIIAEEPLKGKSRKEIQQAVLGRLSSEGVPVEKIVKDAIARDQALDSFQSCAGQKMKDRATACKKRLLEIEEQIRQLGEEKSGLEQKLKTQEEHWRDWKNRKRTCEREMAQVVGYIIDQPIVSIDEEDTE